jgi:hypothetical protein
MAAKKSTTDARSKSQESKPGPVTLVKMKSQAQYPAYASLEAQQKAVLRAKRAVYAYLQKLTNAHINFAASGNCQSAKFLFEFAGIGDMAAKLAVEARTGQNAYAANAACKKDPVESVLSFYKKLGMEPPVLLPREAAEGAMGAEQAAD